MTACQKEMMASGQACRECGLGPCKRRGYPGWYSPPRDGGLLDDPGSLPRKRPEPPMSNNPMMLQAGETGGEMSDKRRARIQARLFAAEQIRSQDLPDWALEIDPPLSEEGLEEFSKEMVRIAKRIERTALL